MFDMAYLKVEEITQLGAIFYILGLEHPGKDYDEFEFIIINNYGDERIIRINNDENAHGAGLTLNYYGQFWTDAWLTPQTIYTFKARAQFNGVLYDIDDSVTFETLPVILPTGEHYPKYLPSIRRQDYNSCVAMSLTTGMDIFANIQSNTYNNEFSIAYAYGNRSLQPQNDSEESGMNFYSTLVQNTTSGSPKYRLVSPIFPDDLDFNSAKSLYNNASKAAKDNAVYQKFSFVREVYFYDGYGVSEAIMNNGFFMFNFRIPNNFYSVGFSGIVPQPNNYSYENHSMVIIGWKRISGEAHWIAQNSWGTGWGDGGRCYIPCDWGTNSPKPSDVFSWVCDTYEVYDDPIDPPVSTRPPLFYWKYPKIQNESFNLTANEWSDLLKNINLVRNYKGLTNYNFTSPSINKPFYAYMYNEARDAINDIPYAGFYIPLVRQGEIITAYNMNILVSELNTIN